MREEIVIIPYCRHHDTGNNGSDIYSRRPERPGRGRGETVEGGILNGPV